MFKIDWIPVESKLRRFGWIGLVGAALIGWTVTRMAPETEAAGIWVVFGSVALACGLLALFSPKRLKPIYLLVVCLVWVAVLPVTLVFKVLGLGPVGGLSDPGKFEAGDFGGNAGNIPDDADPED